ncbi:MAG: acyl carrier protein [Proteobacteria bacterium]|nr:acyl carrier protein [Pseudomonadota bacterium]
MTDQELLERFSRILADLLGEDHLELAMNTRRADVPNWDSFSYINFIAAVEMELGIRFGIADVESFEDVGAIVRGAQRLQAG